MTDKTLSPMVVDKKKLQHAIFEVVFRRGFHDEEDTECQVEVSEYADDIVDRLNPATRSDLEAVIREVGGVEVWYCEKHRGLRAQGLRNECTWGADARRFGFDDYEDCRISKHLILRLDDPIEEG